MGNEYIGLDVGQNEIALAAPCETYFQVGDYELRFNKVGVLSRVNNANRDRFGVEVKAEIFLRRAPKRRARAPEPQPASITSVVSTDRHGHRDIGVDLHRYAWFRVHRTENMPASR